MDKKYTVKITPQAQEQVNDIIKYIQLKLQAPETALNLLETFESSFLSLSELPHRLSLINDEPWRSYGIRKLLVKNYFVYFWIDETSDTVHIIAVIYAGSDQYKQLSQMI